MLLILTVGDLMSNIVTVVTVTEVAMKFYNREKELKILNNISQIPAQFVTC